MSTRTNIAVPIVLEKSERYGSLLHAYHFRDPLDYGRVWRWQLERARLRALEAAGDLLVLLEHEPVYTIGPRGNLDHLLVEPEQLKSLGIALERVDRGGDITYHGPGQLVGYPIIRLAGAGRRVRAYVAALEGALIGTAAHYGVVADRVPGLTGVWVGREKLAAIGVRVTRGVAYHGFALNVGPDLTPFQRIVACGLHGSGSTSLARLLGHDVAVADVAAIAAREVASACGLTLASVTPMDRTLEMLAQLGAPEQVLGGAVQDTRQSVEPFITSV